MLVVEDVEQFAATRHAELSGCVGTDFLAFLPLPDLSGVRPMFQARSDQRVVINGAAIHVTDSSSLPSAVKSFYEDFALMLPVDFATTASAVDRAVAYARDVFDRHHIRRNSNMPTDMEVQIESKLDADMAAEEQSLGCTSLIAEGHIVGRRTLSGLQPSGALHLGNYFGAMQQHVEAQSDNEGFFFIASYHALTTVKDPELLRRMTRDVAVDYLAVGLDPERVALYRQTDVPQVTELSWILGCVGSMGDLERAVSYKDKVSRGIIPNIGLFTYPQLMAADILIMRAEIIPVGQDQLQHIEIARRFAFRFNRTYGDAILTIPQAKLNDAKTVAGIDGQKMSKSSGNSIPLFAEPAAVRKLIYSIRTDSAPIEAPKDPETCRVFALLKLLATPGEAVAWAERYRGGGLAYGDVKQRVFELYEARFGAARERRFELAQHPERVEEILQEGARKARHIAEAVMRDVRQAVGIPVQPCRT